MSDFDDEDDSSEGPSEDEEEFRDSYNPGSYKAEEEKPQRDNSYDSDSGEEEEDKEYYPIDIYQRKRFFKGYNHPPIDNFWCWCHPRNLPIICNDKFVTGSKSRYLYYVFLTSFTEYVDHYSDSYYPVSPYIYFGLIPQFLFLYILPPISFFLRFSPLYYVCDEYRRQFIRWCQYFFFSYFINAYLVLSVSGAFGSLGVYPLIRTALFIFNRSENIEIELFFFLVLLVWNLAVIVGYIITFLSNVWITTGFFCMMFTNLERPYSSKEYDELGGESDGDDEKD